MKKIYLFVLIASSLILLMAGCTKETGSGAGEGIPMRVAPSLAADSKASLQTADLQAFYLQLDCTDKLFSFFGKVSRNGSKWSASQPLLWKDKTTPVNYCAVCFGDHAFTAAEFAGGVNLAVPADQSTQAGLNRADLLTLKASDSKYEDTVGGTLPVQLGHGLAKVNFVLSLGDAFYDAGIGLTANPVTALTVKGANTGFNFKPKTGAVTVTGATRADITPLAGTYAPGTATAKTAKVTYEAILVPQSFAAGALSVSLTIGNGKYTWSNTESITLVAGKTVNLPISVTTTPSKPKINGHEYVDLGLGVKWATCNVGATKPEELGDYFAWGETEPHYSSQSPLTWKNGKEGYNWDTYFDTIDGGSVFTKYAVDKKTVLEAEDDAAAANWGGTWRMPTEAEWRQLLALDKQWVENYNGSSVNGYTFTGNGNTIFLPAAGYRTSFDLFGKSFGDYWSSSLYVDDNNPNNQNAYGVFLSWNVVHCNSELRFLGRSVRPVSK